MDVSREGLDIATDYSDQRCSFANNDEIAAQALSCLEKLNPTLVVLEATGGIEMPVAATLAVAGIPIAVVNPRQVRDFARATGRLAKTDSIHAKVLALFAAAIRLMNLRMYCIIRRRTRCPARLS